MSHCDKLLKNHIAPHISSHTFATLAADRIPIRMLQKLYGHSDITTTLGYTVHFVHKDADEALVSVVGG